MGFSAELRRSAGPRLALVAVAALLAAGFTTGPETTAATFTSTSTTESSITAREACLVQKEVQAQAYTSGLLDQAKPALRWSFSDGVLPGDAPAEGASRPGTEARGLLQCDPADFPETKTAPGSLRLTQGGTAGLAVASQPLTTSFTLLLWVSPDAKAEGELASVSNSTGELTLGLSGSTVNLSVPGSDKAATLAISTKVKGAAHLVAATFDGDALVLTVDGAAAEAVKTTWTPSDPKGPSTFTIGGRTDHPSAGALVDEVTLLTGPASAAWLKGLVTSNLWWVPANWTAGQFPVPEPSAAVPPATVAAPELVVDPAPPVDPSSSPTTPVTVEPTAETTTTPTTIPQTTDERRSKSTMSRHKPSR